MLDFANSRALKSKQTKVTTASNTIKDVVLVDLVELYSSSEIELLQQALQLIDSGKKRIQCLKEKRKQEEKQREGFEKTLHDAAYNQALLALDTMSLSELYMLSVCFSYSSTTVVELIQDYDHQHYLASVQRWLDTGSRDDIHFEQSPEEVHEEWQCGIASAAVETISWPCLKYHRNHQGSVVTYVEPQGTSDDFPQSIYNTVIEKNQSNLTAECLAVIHAIAMYENNAERVRKILESLGQ
ncbi:hypothetical protein [Photobacterium lutimaris]|uniref:Uncharacterized protein n=1 Tax=Photobacterium lutimaris TaxID=388278 RepID=A0A2T3J3L2_9GAMM|nr:hypothetical protein [Photobacterium lutimaris]PSU35887.1 hypothetical protein C9I99_02380 [Photobacterium lutimaris]TDR78961.1 hypothetical protein DFP78_101475 [Photobacterium lutimaris]